MRRSRRATVPLWAARQAVSVSISSLPPVCAALAGGAFSPGAFVWLRAHRRLHFCVFRSSLTDDRTLINDTRDACKHALQSPNPGMLSPPAAMAWPQAKRRRLWRLPAGLWAAASLSGGPTGAKEGVGRVTARRAPGARAGCVSTPYHPRFRGWSSPPAAVVRSRVNRRRAEVKGLDPDFRFCRDWKGPLAGPRGCLWGRSAIGVKARPRPAPHPPGVSAASSKP